MKKSWRAVLIAALGILALCGVWFWLLALPSFPPYTGDGEFRNTSWRFLDITLPGYCIKFPRFELSSNLDASYTVENLPDIDRDVALYLGVDEQEPNGDSGSIDELKAEIQVDVYDSENRLIVHLICPLQLFAKNQWYLLDQSFLKPREGAQYRVSIQYSGDPQFGSTKGFLFMRCRHTL